MATTTTQGPFLQTKTGRYYQAGYPAYGIPAYIAGTSTTSTSTIRSWSTVRVKSDGPTPRRRKPQGMDLVSSLLGGLTAWNHETTITTRGLYGDGIGNLMVNDFTAGPPVRMAEIEAKARSRSIMNARREIKGEVWNLSTFMAELPETWNYVRQVASGLLKSYQAVKRGDIKKLHNMVFPLKGGDTYRGGRGRYTKKYPAYGNSLERGIENKWMEWRYAITPMMYDLDDALKYLYSSSMNIMLRRIEATGVEKDFTTYKSSGGLATQEVSTRCKTVVYFSVQPGVNGFKKLGLLNPVATLYELVPLSFVLDWFLPLGDYLASLDAMASVSVFGSTQSTSSRLRSISDKSLVNIAPPGYKAWQTPNVWEKRSFTRSVNPTLDIQAPTFSMSLNANRLVDSFVLLRYAFSKS